MMQQPQTVERASRNQRPSVESLVFEHSQALRYWLATRVRRDDVDNASQEVWLRVSKHYGEKFDGKNFRAWLFQIARNYLVDESRRKRPVTAVDEAEMETADVGAREPFEILIDRERRKQLATCIEKLGEPRKAIVKARASGMKYDEFVADMNLSNQQASQHFFAARKLLRVCLESPMTEAC